MVSGRGQSLVHGGIRASDYFTHCHCFFGKLKRPTIRLFKSVSRWNSIPAETASANGWPHIGPSGIAPDNNGSIQVAHHCNEDAPMDVRTGDADNCICAEQPVVMVPIILIGLDELKFGIGYCFAFTHARGHRVNTLCRGILCCLSRQIVGFWGFLGSPLAQVRRNGSAFGL